jgi:hypothetical protein
MEDSDVQIQPDGGRSRIAYLYIVEDAENEPQSKKEASEALKAVKLEIPKGRVEVFYIPPIPIASNNHDKTIDEIILNEMKVLTTNNSEFAVALTHNWESPYVLWPILIPGNDILKLESTEVKFEVTWDYLNIVHATSDQIELMIKCAATCFSRYRSLSMAIRSMQAHADALISALDGKTSQQSAFHENENEQDRRALKVDLMKVDATTSLRWGFEFRLLDAISEAWNLSGLERKAKESEATIAQLDGELEAKRSGERSNEQRRQTQKLTFFVATFALVQVPSTVLQIGERWFNQTSSNQMPSNQMPSNQWNEPINIFSLSAVVVSAGIWLRMLFIYQRQKRASNLIS